MNPIETFRILKQAARKSPGLKIHEQRIATAPKISPVGGLMQPADVAPGTELAGLNKDETADFGRQIQLYRENNKLQPSDALGIPLFRGAPPEQGVRDQYEAIKRHNTGGWWGNSTGSNTYDGLINNDAVRQKLEAEADIIKMTPQEYLEEIDTIGMTPNDIRPGTTRANVRAASAEFDRIDQQRARTIEAAGANANDADRQWLHDYRMGNQPIAYTDREPRGIDQSAYGRSQGLGGANADRRSSLPNAADLEVAQHQIDMTAASPEEIARTSISDLASVMSSDSDSRLGNFLSPDERQTFGRLLETPFEQWTEGERDMASAFTTYDISPLRGLGTRSSDEFVQQPLVLNQSGQPIYPSDLVAMGDELEDVFRAGLLSGQDEADADRLLNMVPADMTSADRDRMYEILGRAQPDTHLSGDQIDNVMRGMRQVEQADMIVGRLQRIDPGVLEELPQIHQDEINRLVNTDIAMWTDEDISNARELVHSVEDEQIRTARRLLYGPDEELPLNEQLIDVVHGSRSFTDLPTDTQRQVSRLVRTPLRDWTNEDRAFADNLIHDEAMFGPGSPAHDAQAATPPGRRLGIDQVRDQLAVHQRDGNLTGDDDIAAVNLLGVRGWTSGEQDEARRLLARAISPPRMLDERTTLNPEIPQYNDEIDDFARQMIGHSGGTDLPVLDYTKETMDGRKRAQAAIRLGIKEMPVVVVKSNRPVHAQTIAQPGYFRGQVIDEKADKEVGYINTFTDVRNKTVSVTYSHLQPMHRGRGVGLEMYDDLIRTAVKKGYTFTSDGTLSQFSYRIWKSLEKAGYKLKKNPEATGDDLRGWSSHGHGPIFTVIGVPPK